MEDPRERNEQNWREATNKIIAEQMVSNLEKLLDGKATHCVCSDAKSSHEKIIIEYNHKNK